MNIADTSVGTIEGFDVQFLTNHGLTKEQAEHLVGDTQESPKAEPAAPTAVTVAPQCPKCGWHVDGTPPAKIKPEDYARIVEDLLFTGRYSHTVKLFGDRITVVFRTLYTSEEDLCTSVAKTTLARLTEQTPARIVEAIHTGGELVLAAAIAEVSMGARVAYTAPTTVTDPVETAKALSSVLKSAEVRAAVVRAFDQFRASVEHAMVATQSANF